MSRMWNDRLRTGVDFIDTQHMVLCQAVDALVELLGTEHKESEVEHFLKCLLVYAKIHFREEEETFRSSGLPEAEIRMQMFDHFQFEDVVRGLEHRWRSGEPDVAEVAEKMAQRWVKAHMEAMDLPMMKEVLRRQAFGSRSVGNRTDQSESNSSIRENTRAY